MNNQQHYNRNFPQHFVRRVPARYPMEMGRPPPLPPVPITPTPIGPPTPVQRPFHASPSRTPSTESSVYSVGKHGNRLQLPESPRTPKRGRTMILMAVLDDDNNNNDSNSPHSVPPRFPNRRAVSDSVIVPPPRQFPMFYPPPTMAASAAAAAPLQPRNRGLPAPTQQQIRAVSLPHLSFPPRTVPQTPSWSSEESIPTANRRRRKSAAMYGNQEKVHETVQYRRASIPPQQQLYPQQQHIRHPQQQRHIQHQQQHQHQHNQHQHQLQQHNQHQHQLQHNQHQQQLQHNQHQQHLQQQQQQHNQQQQQHNQQQLQQSFTYKQTIQPPPTLTTNNLVSSRSQTPSPTPSPPTLTIGDQFWTSLDKSFNQVDISGGESDDAVSSLQDPDSLDDNDLIQQPQQQQELTTPEIESLVWYMVDTVHALPKSMPQIAGDKLLEIIYKSISVIDIEDMLLSATDFVKAYRQFKRQGIPFKVDIGYRYFLKRPGVKPGQEKLEETTSAASTNSGMPGVYTGDDPFTFYPHHVEDHTMIVGIIVARLLGNVETVKRRTKKKQQLFLMSQTQQQQQASSLSSSSSSSPPRPNPTGTATNSSSCNTVRMILHKNSPPAVILQSPHQCLPLLRFLPANVVDMLDNESLGNLVLYDYHCRLQKIMDECFNENVPTKVPVPLPSEHPVFQPI